MIPKLKSLVASGKALKAIRVISEYISKTDNEKYNELILLSGQITKNHGLFNQSLIDLDTYKLSEAKTTFRLLSMIDSIDVKELEEFRKNGSGSKVDYITKMLFLASQPVAVHNLELDKEYLEIRRTFKGFRNKFVLTEEFDVTLDSFFEAIKEEQPHIIHYAGNGQIDGIDFLRIDKENHLVPFEFLASAFRLAQGNIEMVFFNACYSALFAKVVSRFIPYAIGIKGVISIDNAISFASGFYSALAIEKDYEQAYENGKKLMTNTNQDCNYLLYHNGSSKDGKGIPEDFYVPVKVRSLGDMKAVGEIKDR